MAEGSSVCSRESLVLLHTQVGSISKTSFCMKLCVQDDKMGAVSLLSELLILHTESTCGS